MTDLNQLLTELHAELTRIAVPLYEGLAHSIAQANIDLKRYKHAKYPHLWSMHVRAAMREFNDEGAALPPGWALSGNPALMGQLSFVNADLGYATRFLKENNRVHPGGIPPAGNNNARKKQWAQDPLFDLAANCARPRNIELVHSWDFGRDEDGRIDLNTFRSRIVHTTSAGVFGQRVPLDFFFDLLPGGDLHAHSRFDGDASEDDFFFTAQADINDQ